MGSMGVSYPVPNVSYFIWINLEQVSEAIQSGDGGCSKFGSASLICPHPKLQLATVGAFKNYLGCLVLFVEKI